MLSAEGKVVKRELENFNQSKKQLRILQEELEGWKRLDGAVRSASLEQTVSGGQTITYAEKRVIRMEELKELISKQIDNAIELEDKFLKSIESLDVASQNLLMERYMTGKPLNKIIRESNYSDRQIYRKYDAAFEEIAEKSKDVSKCQ